MRRRKPKVITICTYTVRDLDNRDDLIFVSDSQDVQAIKEYFGNPPELEDFDSFFVKIEDGEYTEVYGVEGIVPLLEKDACKIELVW